MKIGNIDLGDNPLFLAPMESITDVSFRYICKKYGADFMYTEFISSDGLIRNAQKTIKKMMIYDFERPIAIQIYGHLPEAMVEAAKIAEESNPDVIDINFGCPAKKIAARGAGAGMLRNIPLMLEITEKVVKAVKIPVTVKTRLGWDENSKNIVEIAKRLQDAGIQALTIHGRTRMQMFKGKADWTLIGEVKNDPAIYIPIIGNGDITTPEEAKYAFDKYGVDAIMIGRASIGHPWIFKEIKYYLKNNDKLPQPSIKEIVDIAKLHFLKSIEFKGIPVGIYEMRRHFVNYFKGLPHFKDLKIKLVTSTDVDEILKIINIIEEKYSS